MQIEFESKDVKSVCMDIDVAEKFFGGNKLLAKSLLIRVYEIEQLETLMDIIKIPSLHFHKLTNKKKKEF